MMKEFSTNRIRELREDRDLRQSDVAKATGIDQRSLSNYETGKTLLDSQKIIKLAEFFGVTCDYLLGITERNIEDTQAVINEIEDIRNRLAYLERFLKRI